MTTSQRTAILLFTRTAEEESRHKLLAPSGSLQVNRQLVDRMIRQSRQVLAQSGFDWFEVDSTQQHGADFGQRLQHALDQVFDSGYNKVVVVGNDCPDLSTELLSAAVSELNTRDWVIGPTPDGGAYLLGLTQGQYSPADLIALDWQSPELLDELVQLAGPTLALLQVHSDLNSQQDLLALLRQRAHSALARAFQSILASFAQPGSRNLRPVVVKRHSTSMSRRGPPRA